MESNKKNKAQSTPETNNSKKTPPARRSMYEGGPKHQSLKDEFLSCHKRENQEYDGKLYHHETSRSAHQGVEVRQVTPLLFLFKWVVLGVVGLVLVAVLKNFLSGFNKDAADELTSLRAQVVELQQSRVERPQLADAGLDRIPASVLRWKSACEQVVAAEDLMCWPRYNEARRRLHEALVLMPGCQPAQVLTAQIAMKSGEYERAANMLVQSLNMTPDRHDLVVLLAQSLEKLGKDPEAFVVAEWALSIQSNDLDVLGIASRTSNRLKDWVSALKYFEQTLVVDESDLAALKGASAIYFRDKNYGKALPLFSRLMALESGEWRYFFNVAVCQAQLGRAEGAVTTLELAAAHFGDARISGWVSDSEFDPVREDYLFAEFEKRVAQVVRRKGEKKIDQRKGLLVPAGSESL